MASKPEVAEASKVESETSNLVDKKLDETEDVPDPDEDDLDDLDGM